MKRTPLNGRRTPLERRKGLDTSGGGTLRRRAPLPRHQPATAAAKARPRRPELDVPEDTRRLLRARSRGRCEAQVLGECYGDAGDVHHRKRRREGGHGIANLVDLCRGCHAWAHAHPTDAKALGLIVPTWADPADVELRLLSHLTGVRVPVRLATDGTYLVDGVHVSGTAAAVDAVRRDLLTLRAQP